MTEISRRALLTGIGAVAAAKIAPIADVAPALAQPIVGVAPGPRHGAYHFDLTRAVLQCWDGESWRVVGTALGIETSEAEMNFGPLEATYGSALPCRRDP